MNKYRLLLVYIVVILGVVGIGFLLYKTSEQQVANLPGIAYEIQGQNHITEGSFEHPPYNSNPPASGPHWPKAANWGVYSSEQPDEQLVHNLEHGGIWISYKPGSVSEQDIKLLNDFATRYPLIVVEPRSKNDSAISLAAWGRVQNLDAYNETTIIKFIEAYHNKGPEKVM